MPPRPTHIPHNAERTALQKMSPTRGLTAEGLHPADSQTIAGMVAKGWIEKQPDGQTYCITPAGDSALRAVIQSRDSRGKDLTRRSG
jgi:predicted transcriptional regulator